MKQEGSVCRCIRCREVRGQKIDAESLRLDRIEYETDATQEQFLSYVTPDDRLSGFLRLSLPQATPPIEELSGCAVIREVHVHGPALELGNRQVGTAQHSGLGTRLIEEARRVAREAGYARLAVIAAVGTRPYYRERGFERGESYMSEHL
jgi:elongator complex protein 3